MVVTPLLTNSGMLHLNVFYTFFFNDTATTEIYTLSLHDALPILQNAFDITDSFPLGGFHSEPGWFNSHTSLPLRMGGCYG